MCKYNLLSPYVTSMCMISGLTSWYWITNVGFFPEEDYLPCSQYVLVACSSLSKAEAPSEFPLLLVLCSFGS